MRFLEKLNSPIAVAIVLVVFLALNGLLLYSYQHSFPSTKDNAANVPAEETSSSLARGPTTLKETSSSLARETTTTQETTASPGEENLVRVVVSVVDAPVGLSILEDGQGVYDQVADPGFSEEFEAGEAITISAANADAVEVEVNGQNLGRLGESGVGVTRTFTASS